MYLYFDTVMGLAWSNDPERYEGSSIATGRVSHARQVKGNEPDKKGYPGSPGWGLGVGLNLTPQKSIVLKPHDKPQIKENRLGKLMSKIEKLGGNALSGLRLDLGCNTITAGALAVDIQ